MNVPSSSAPSPPAFICDRCRAPIVTPESWVYDEGKRNVFHQACPTGVTSEPGSPPSAEGLEVGAESPLCRRCLTPIVSGALVLFDPGEWLHLRCRVEELAREAFGPDNEARDTRDLATGLLRRAELVVDELLRRRARRAPASTPMPGG
jgi:hypothetical protein